MDYLDKQALLRHPMLGMMAANVAPEFGIEETAAYLESAHLEAEELGRSAENGVGGASGFLEVFIESAVRSEGWRRWMTDRDGGLSVDEMLRGGARRGPVPTGMWTSGPGGRLSVMLPASISRD